MDKHSLNPDMGIEIEKALGGKGSEGDHRLVFGDCLAGMRALPDLSVGCVITDAPYSDHVHKNLGRENRNDGAESRDDLSFECLTSALAEAVAIEACRAAARWLLFFCDEQAIGMWIAAAEKAGGEYVRTGTWVKTDPMPQMTGDRPAAGTEPIVICHAPRVSGRMRWNGGGKAATWTGTIRSEGKRVHPAQKPEWLMEALVRDFTDPGEMILDPFAGSGTTLVACKRLGRRALGFERGWATLTKEEQETMPEHAQAGLLYARNAALVAKSQARIDAAREQFNLGPRPPKPRQNPLFEKQKPITPYPTVGGQNE